MATAIPAGNTYVTTQQLGSLRLFNQNNGGYTNPLNNKAYTDPQYAVKGSDGAVSGYNLPNDIYAQAIAGNTLNNRSGFSPGRGADIAVYGTAAPGAAPVTAAPITNATPTAAAPTQAAPASATSVVSGGASTSTPAPTPAAPAAPAGPKPISLADVMSGGVSPATQNTSDSSGAPLTWVNGALAPDPMWDGVDRSKQAAPAIPKVAPGTINIGGRLIRNPLQGQMSPNTSGGVFS